MSKPPPLGKLGALALEKIRERVETVQDREPCSYCGVRGDFGCKHRKAA